MHVDESENADSQTSQLSNASSGKGARYVRSASQYSFQAVENAQMLHTVTTAAQTTQLYPTTTSADRTINYTDVIPRAHKSHMRKIAPIIMSIHTK